MITKQHTEALPKSLDEVLEFVKRCLTLDNVQEVTIRPDTMSVRRSVESDNQPVLPENSDVGVDAEFILENIKLDHYPFEPDEHSYLTLVGVTGLITDRKLKPSHILAPGDEDFKEILAAWLGLEDLADSNILGMRLTYFSSDRFQDKIVVVGTSSGYLTDALYGVVVDIV
jgi:hypothetical protein